MSKRDPAETLRQMRDFVDEACGLAKGKSRGDLDNDLGFRRHAERVAELIGEAANRLPPEIRDAWPLVPWRQIISMRNWLIHGYDGIDTDILWDVLDHHAPELGPKIDEILAAEE